MKIVVSNHQCVHLWAHQSQSHARSGSMSFNHEIIRSYSQEIGRFVEGTKKRKAVIITTEDWSITTSRHCSMVRSATSHLTQFFLPLRWIGRTTGDTIAYAHTYARKEIRESLDKAGRARKNKDWHLSCVRHQADHFNRLAEFYGSKKRIILPADFTGMVEEAKRQAAEQARKDAKRQAELQKANALENARREAVAKQSLADWKAGTVNRISYDSHLPDIYLRLIRDGQVIQTSMGAEFPMEHGKRAYLIMSRLNKAGREYQRNGHTIHCGHFPIDRMDFRGIQAGCHRISWDSLNEFAQRAGWTESENIDDGTDTDENPGNGHPAENSGQNGTTGNHRIEIGSDSTSEGMDIQSAVAPVPSGNVSTDK